VSLSNPQEPSTLREVYRDSLLGDMIPFWLRHGLDREHGGFVEQRQ
jgi:N-acylglucosamine 2-epimerase